MFKLIAENKHIIWLFVVYTFTFLLSELVINSHIAALIGAENLLTFYSVGILCTGLGYLSFGLWSIKKEEIKPRKAMLIFCMSLYVIFMATGLLAHVSNTIHTVVFALALLLFGYVGGFVHYCASCALQNSPAMGKIIGFSMFVAIVLQYIVQKVAITEISLWVAMVIGAISIGYIVWHPAKDWTFEGLLPYKADSDACPAKAVVAVAVVALSTICLGFNDSLVTYFDAEGKLVLSEWPRLFYAIGLLIAGILADYGKRRFLAIGTALSLLFAFPAVSYLGLSGYMNLSMSFMYFYCGFYVIYLTVCFLDIAPKTKYPALWAGMGRIMRSLFTAITVLPAMWVFKTWGIQCVQLFTTFAVFGAIVALWLFEKNAARKEMEELKLELSSKRDDKTNKFQTFIEEHNFTPREVDVLKIIIKSSITTKEMANELAISERVCQRYLTSIYEKTGTDSRIELMLKYFNE